MLGIRMNRVEGRDRAGGGMKEASWVLGRLYVWPESQLSNTCFVVIHWAGDSWTVCFSACVFYFHNKKAWSP